MGLLIFLFLLFVFLQIPAVQRSIADYTSSQLIKKSGGDLSIKDAAFDIYRGVVLGDVLLTDVEQDTLIHVGEISISPTNTLLSLVGDLSFSDLYIEGATVHMVRRRGETTFNWQRFLSSMASSSSSSDSEAVPVFLSHLSLSDVQLVYRDVPRGHQIDGRLEGLELDINQIDTSTIDVARLVLTAPSVEFRQLIESGDIVKDPKSVREKEKNGEPASIPLIKVGRLSVINGSARTVSIDGASKSVSGVSTVMKDIVLTDLLNWTAELRDFSLSSPDMTIKHVSAHRVTRSGGRLSIDSLFFRLNRSFGAADIRISDLGDGWAIADAESTVRVNNMKIRPSELSRLIPDIDKALSGSRLKNEFFQMNGDYRIKDGNVAIRDMQLWINGSHHLSARGNISAGDPVLGQLINLEIIDLRTDPNDLERLLPRIKLPKEVKKLGALRFKGTFDGFTKDFVAQGALDSELGHVDMDIKFDVGGGAGDTVDYSGILALQDFDMARFTGDEQFGTVSARLNIEKGSGVDLENSNALLSAVVDQFTYRDYVYRNAQFKGQLSRKVLNGHFAVQDSSLDFRFDGVVDLSRSEPIYDFNVKANKIDLCELNLSDFPCQVSFNSDINFRGKDIYSVEGYSLLTDVDLIKDDRHLHIDRLGINSRRLGNKDMLFTVQSDFVDSRMEGTFDLLDLVPFLKYHIYKNHTDHYRLIGSPPMGDSLSTQSFTYEISIKERLDEVFEFLELPIHAAPGTSINGAVTEDNGRMSLHLSTPFLRYNEWAGKALSLHFNSAPELGSLDVKMDSMFGPEFESEKVLFNTNITKDQMVWVVDAIIDDRNKVDLEARSIVENKGYFTEFLYDDILIDSVLWTILPNPGVGIYPGKLNIQSFVMTDGNRSVGLRDIAGRGLEVSANEFNIELINPIIDYKELYFTGTATVQAEIEDIYEMRGIEGSIDVPDFQINGDDFGTLKLNAKRGGEGLVDLDMHIEKDTQQIHVVGTYNESEKYLNTDIAVDNYPMNFFEYIITDGISETVGQIDITGGIRGYVNNADSMKMDVVANVRDAGVRIDYIGAYYRIDQARVPISETLIDFTGVTLIDELDNRAVMEGGIRHEFLGAIRADATITSDRFIALNTTKEDNPTYYGIGVGPIKAVFDGPFSELDMDVTATAGPLSRLYIPILSTQGGYDESFIRFDYKTDQDSISNRKALAERLRASGVAFDMNLTFDQEAEVQIIYDEATSNVLIGHGEGDLRIEIKRDGDFTIFGQYNVTSGEYLYTAFNFIAKPFIIGQGGTVTWTGDPVNANLDIKARYPGLRAPLNVLLQEYVEGSGVSEAEFLQRRNVDLTLELTDNLFSPTINFDISFPDLTGQIRTLADAKIQTLKATENGINNQVVGLMVFRNFLPDNNPFANLGGADLTAVGNNTLTEFLTSQLSLLASDYLSSRLAGGIISGIDLEFALSQNQYGFQQPGEGIELVPDEVNLNLRNRFKNDNFVLNIGGNYVRENGLGNLNDYLTGDFSFDWFLTEDRRLKLRLYAIYDYDETNLARRQKYGFGINFRKEFGKLSDVSLTGALDQVVEQLNNGQTKSPSQ